MARVITKNNKRNFQKTEKKYIRTLYGNREKEIYVPISRLKEMKELIDKGYVLALAE